MCYIAYSIKPYSCKKPINTFYGKNESSYQFNNSLRMIKLSFKNPYLIVVFAILVSVMSFVLVPRMAVDILPQFKKSAMQILTLYPGMPAEVVEKDITSRMERWTGQSNGILKQESKSLMGVSLVTNYYQEDVTAAEAMANTSSYAMSDMYYQYSYCLVSCMDTDTIYFH